MGKRLAFPFTTAILTTALAACSGAPTKNDQQPIVQDATGTSQTAQAYPSEPTLLMQAEPEQATMPLANQIHIKPDYPQDYVVKRGDTLWDIASKFLKDPWYWPEIWYRNPQIENPHLIYPGDVISLIYVDGRPRIQVSRGGAARESYSTGTRLSPSIRSQPLDAHIPVIPSNAIRQFLSKPSVVTLEEWKKAPYIIGSDDRRLILSTGHRIYVRGELDKERIRFSVFRKGNTLKDPESGEILGYEIIDAGEARITAYDDPASGVIVTATREVLVGDRLLPVDRSEINNLYYPAVPDMKVSGQIISLFDAISSIARNQIAVINRGARDGLEVGHLLATYRKGAVIRDRFHPEQKDLVQLPDERSGLMMIFKTFDNVSYGLILESNRAIHNLDAVRTPR